MKWNKIILIIEESVKNKVLTSILAASLIGGSGIMLSNTNSLKNLSVNKTILVQSSNNSATTYIVQSGNTLSGIAYKYGVTVSQL